MNMLLCLTQVVLLSLIQPLRIAASGAVSPAPGNAAASAEIEDLKNPAIQALLMAQYNGKRVSYAIDRTLEKPGNALPQPLNTALHNCSDRYSNAVAHIGDSVKALLTPTVYYEDVKTWINVAITSAGVCQQAILDAHAPPVSEMRLFQGSADNNENAVFIKLCNNSLSNVTALQTSLNNLQPKSKRPKFLSRSWDVFERVGRDKVHNIRKSEFKSTYLRYRDFSP